jgi:hypothetical protein
MIVNSSLFIRENIMENGIPAPTAIQILLITPCLVASLATSIIKLKWIINIERKADIHIAVQHVFDAIPEDEQIKTDL